jgi:23S rRNA pseudouridine1911/1915/1917 synthase
MDRQALHAYRLAFQHPKSGDAVAYIAPLPEDMQICLTRLTQLGVK